MAPDHLEALVEAAVGATPGRPLGLAEVQGAHPGARSGLAFEAYADPAFNVFDNVVLVGPPLEIPAAHRAAVLSGGRPAVPPYHVAVVTDDITQSNEDVLGALEMVRRHGDARNGGLIRHLSYPDEYFDDPELAAALLESLVDDPLLAAVVVNQAPPGTAEGFLRIRAARPEVWLLSGESHEDVGVIAPAADLVLAADFISRGYLIPYAAREMGAEALVHLSFPRHLSIDTIALRLKIMEAAATDLGLRFIRETAPDPVEDGMEPAVEFVDRALPGWLERYGPRTAFFATNDAHTAPILRGVAEHGGFFVTADIPSALLGYPEAFGVDVGPYLGRWPELRTAVEEAVVSAGGGGRMGLWTYPLGFAQTAGLVEFAKRLIEGSSEVDDLKALLAILSENYPGAEWNGSLLNDMLTGKPLRNYFLVYQDVYILGRGYIPTTKVAIPDKYYAIRLD
jgi:hypothetical protein